MAIYDSFFELWCGSNVLNQNVDCAFFALRLRFEEADAGGQVKIVALKLGWRNTNRSLTLGCSTRYELA